MYDADAIEQHTDEIAELKLLIRKLIAHGNGNIVGFTEADYHLMAAIDV